MAKVGLRAYNQVPSAREMSGDKSKPPPYNLKVRLTPDEHERLLHRIPLGMSLTSWVKARLLSDVTMPRSDIRAMHEIAAAMIQTVANLQAKAKREGRDPTGAIDDETGARLRAFLQQITDLMIAER